MENSMQWFVLASWGFSIALLIIDSIKQDKRLDKLERTLEKVEKAKNKREVTG